MIGLNKLKTYEDHTNEIARLESDRNSYNGNWFSGRDTPMKKCASKRINEIYNRIDRLFIKELGNA